MTLLVQDFQFRGCQGSGKLGRPVPIQQRHQVGLLVQQLRELHDVEILDNAWSSVDADLTSPSRKRPLTEPVIAGDEFGVEVGESALATQVMLRTQMPQKRDLPSGFANDVMSSYDTPRPYREPQAASNRSGPLAKNSRTMANTSESLLGLLRNHNTICPSRHGVVSEMPVSEFSETHEQAAQQLVGSERRPAPQAASSEKTLVNHRRETIGRSEQKAYRVDITGVPRVTPKVLRNVDDDTQLSINQESRFLTEQESEHSGKQRNPQTTPGRKIQALEKHEVRTKNSKDFSIATSSNKNTGGHAANDPWKVSNLI